jgi:hypothetical protein
MSDGPSPGATRPRRRLLAAGLTTVALAGTAAAIAPANTAGVRDPRGDTARGLRSYLDIRVARAGHAGDQQLEHVVRMQRATRDTPHALQIDIRIGSRTRYRVFGSGAGEEAPILDLRRGERVGSATVSRSGRRVEFVFDRAVIGDPPAYRWAVTANPNPGIFRGKFDRAPNRRFKRHVLR